MVRKAEKVSGLVLDLVLGLDWIEVGLEHVWSSRGVFDLSENV